MTGRVTGVVAAALAAFFAASAVILGWRAAGQAAWVSHGVSRGGQLTASLTATRAAYFSPTRLKEITGANLEVTQAITEAAGAGYPALAVWDVSTAVYDRTNHQRLEPTTATLVFDRATAELINCCGENVNGNGLIRQSGIAGYAFPAGTRKQTYDVFDTVLGQPEPFAYSGAGVVDGVPAYRFAENVSAAYAGLSPLSSAEPELYSVHRRYWVDPETGAVLKITENEDLYLANPATGAAVTHLFDADLSTTPATVVRLVSQDARGRHALALLGAVRILLFCLAGVCAVTAGWLLTRGRRPRLVPRVRSGGR